MGKKFNNLNLGKSENIDFNKIGGEKTANANTPKAEKPKPKIERKEYCLTLQPFIMKELKRISIEKDIRGNLLLESILLDYLEKNKKKGE